MTRERAIEYHPLATLFPLVEGAEFDELVADIREHGLHEPIVVFEDKILDGRNRHRACIAAGIEPTFTVYQGGDPISYVVSLNLRRRHLNASQRAMVADKLATLKLGDNQHSEGLPIGRSSELLNVGERTVARAREVRKHGAPELVGAVERGEVSVSAAVGVASLPIEAQREILAQYPPREIKNAYKRIRAREMEERRAERIERIAALSNADAGALPQDRKYPLILADPPWTFSAYNAESGIGGAADEHYPLMTHEEICALGVGALTTRNALLFLWAPSVILKEALAVIEAWGFECLTTIVWVKDRSNQGYWVKNLHEFLIIARRGDFPTPTPALRPLSVINAPRREHSRKPDEAYELIERMYPELPKIELFARSARKGWNSWGNQAPPQDMAMMEAHPI
jgi:N6-adenosine-specific RNA methylase IME4/ParB-like chromosome segregation protein Spo0J